jgi:hypothetical protein
MSLETEQHPSSRDRGKTGINNLDKQNFEWLKFSVTSRVDG